MGLHPLLDSNSLAVTAKQHDSTYSSISAIIVCNTGILFSFSSVSVPHKHDLWTDFVTGMKQMGLKVIGWQVDSHGS